MIIIMVLITMATMAMEAMATMVTVAMAAIMDLMATAMVMVTVTMVAVTMVEMVAIMDMMVDIWAIRATISKEQVTWICIKSFLTEEEDNMDRIITCKWLVDTLVVLMVLLTDIIWMT